MARTNIKRDRRTKTLMVASIPTIKKIKGKEYYVFAFKRGTAIVQSVGNGKYGLVDDMYNFICKPKYDFCCYMKRGKIFLCKRNKWGMANCNGDIVVPCEYDHIYSFKHGYAITRNKDKYGLISDTYQTVRKCKYTREEILTVRRELKSQFYYYCT